MVIVQLLSNAQLFAAPWTSAYQVSLSFTISRVCPYSCPLSQWCYLTISSSAIPISFCLWSFSASGSFLMSQFFISGVQKYWSFGFSTSPSSECSVLIYFRFDWFIPVEIQGTLQSCLLYHNSKVLFLPLSAFFMVQLSHPYMTLKKTNKHSFNYMDIFQQRDVFAF